MKQERIKQIHNLQQQIAAMEQEIEHLTENVKIWCKRARVCCGIY